jgi:N,N'-diacetyllegionaminate synthase
VVVIGEHMIGPGEPCFVIAEAGVNHNGDPDLALELVRAAAAAGVDAVKFQLFRAEDVVTGESPKARYQLETTDPNESQFAMLKSLELPLDAYPRLMQAAAGLGLTFLCTCYSPDEIDYLDELGVPAFKFASALIVELPLLRHAAGKDKPLLLSTGMATLDEIRAAVELAHDMDVEVALFQCTTDYPTDPGDANLRVIGTLATEFGVPVGYSDHTVGDAVALAAVACGACMLEKHFTLDRKLAGPDHSASLEPAQFAELVRRVRDVERALGSDVKKPTKSELENATAMRRSLVAARPIPAGTLITADLVTLKRPATGLPPGSIDTIVGSRARVDIAPDTHLTDELVEIAG